MEETLKEFKKKTTFESLIKDLSSQQGNNRGSRNFLFKYLKG